MPIKYLALVLLISSVCLTQGDVPTVPSGLTGKNCEKGTCGWCVGTSENNFCAWCVNSMFSASTSKCVKEGLPENCMTTGMLGVSQGSCQGCKKGYYSKDSKCTKVDKDLVDCAYYEWKESKVVCSGCTNQKVPNVAGDACESPTTPIANCQAHSRSGETVSCEYCNDGYALNSMFGGSCVAVETKGCAFTLTGGICYMCKV